MKDTNNHSSLYFFNSETASPSGAKARQLAREQYPAMMREMFGPDITAGKRRLDR